MVNPNLLRMILKAVRKYATDHLFKYLTSQKSQRKLYNSIRNNQTITENVRRVARQYKQMQEKKALEKRALEAVQKANRANGPPRANDPTSSRNSNNFRWSGDSKSADAFKISENTVIKGNTFWQRNWGKIAGFHVFLGLAFFIYNDSKRSVQAGSDIERERRGGEFTKFT